MKTQTRTPQQEKIATRLAAEFEIDAERVLFLNESKPEEPWLSAEALVTIARRSGNFQAIDEAFNQFIGPLNQVVHSATVIDREGHSYTRSGVSTVGERDDIDDHALAAGRAVGAALTAAGFNPLRPGSLVAFPAKSSLEQAAKADAAHSRLIDLKHIHALAAERGLIRQTPGGQWERYAYRTLLADTFGMKTAAILDQTQRATLVNRIRNLSDEQVSALWADREVDEEFDRVA